MSLQDPMATQPFIAADMTLTPEAHILFLTLLAKVRELDASILALLGDVSDLQDDLAALDARVTALEP